MILAINHVQVSIPHGSEATAREFYCGLLGLAEIEKPESVKANGGLWLQLGNLQVHLGCEDNDHRAKTKSHIAYQVDDLQAWRERLNSAGYELFDNVPVPGFERFDLRDPFGNRIEIMQAARVR